MEKPAKEQLDELKRLSREARVMTRPNSFSQRKREFAILRKRYGSNSHACIELIQHRPVVCCIVYSKSLAEKGFRIIGKPSRRRSRPDNCRIFNSGRIRTANSTSSCPSMPGMLMSVIRTDIWSLCFKRSNASLPLEARIVSQPRSSSMSATTSSTFGSSSTTSTVRLIAVLFSRSTLCGSTRTLSGRSLRRPRPQRWHRNIPNSGQVRIPLPYHL